MIEEPPLLSCTLSDSSRNPVEVRRSLGSDDAVFLNYEHLAQWQDLHVSVDWYGSTLTVYEARGAPDSGWLRIPSPELPATFRLRSAQYQIENASAGLAGASLDLQWHVADSLAWPVFGINQTYWTTTAYVSDDLAGLPRASPPDRLAVDLADAYFEIRYQAPIDAVSVASDRCTTG